MMPTPNTTHPSPTFFLLFTLALISPATRQPPKYRRGKWWTSRRTYQTFILGHRRSGVDKHQIYYFLLQKLQTNK